MNITHEGALNGTESNLESKGQPSRRPTLYIRHVVDVSPPLIREEGEEKWEGEERMGEGKGQTALLLIGRNAAIKDYFTLIFCERVVLPRSSQPMFELQSLDHS
ncbi:unnamed protein product [Danaus chrysippus]|uniref:(African queen) hypothetical protein n=1 Tax=Danaus chrysippus TaxID=151541 RepID=A0A8J2R4H2_9NEOP|nr:unnamed protein product [Danaus chrysippus]